jgi:hypothetical protein
MARNSPHRGVRTGKSGERFRRDATIKTFSRVLLLMGGLPKNDSETLASDTFAFRAMGLIVIALHKYLSSRPCIGKLL